MKHILHLMMFPALVLLIFTGCDQLKGHKSDSPVIAKAGDSEITQEDFLKEINRIPEWARSQFNGDEGKKKFLDELIKKELIYTEAKKMKLDNNKEYLSKVDEFKKMTLVSLLLKKEVEDKASVSDSDVKTFFDQNADKFTTGTQIRASHILVQTEEEAQNIFNKINKGESFASLAKAHSADKGSAQKGGDLGYFGQGKMVPEFEKAALGLKPGEVSEPVKTRFGYHIIKLKDIKKGSPVTFEQAKETIHKQLLAEKKKQLFDSYVEKLKGENEVTTDDTAISAVQLPWEKADTAPATEAQH